MNVFAWLAVGWIATGALMIVANIGKVRKPTTPVVAAVALVIQAAFVWVIVLAATK